MTTDGLTRQQRRHLERIKVKAAANQPYLRRQLADVAVTPSRFPIGAVTIAHIAHDDWCPKLTGGLCRCEPTILYEVLRDAGGEQD